MSLTVQNLTKRFTASGTPAVADVSFVAPSGGITTLLGPSGSGKSTVLRMVAGLEQPDSGQVLFGAEDVTKLPAQKRGLGFVFQSYALFKHMNVRANVAFGLGVRKVPKDERRRKVEELLSLVQLDGLGERYPAELSGGQRQRVAFARALAISPKVLLLDEPFGALDAQVRKELRTWLRRLHDEIHVTTVFVTHDQEEAMDVADRIVVMANARVEQVGTPDELYDQPANPFVMSFLGPVTRLDHTLVRPHDLELLHDPAPGTTAATVVRVARLGFEVRVEILIDGNEAFVQVTRDSAERLGVEAGSTVHVRPVEGALTMAADPPVVREPALAGPSA